MALTVEDIAMGVGRGWAYEFDDEAEARKFLATQRGHVLRRVVDPNGQTGGARYLVTPETDSRWAGTGLIVGVSPP